MSLHNLIQRYNNLSIFTKLIIPQGVALIIGTLYIIYTYQHISSITNNYSTVKEKMIPALEKSKTNIMLLKQIANDFTFATLSSEPDFLESTYIYHNQILDNLAHISKLTGINITLYRKMYLDYYHFTFDLSNQMIEKGTQADRKMEDVLTYYQHTNQNFNLLNQKVKQLISYNTDKVSHSLNRFHTNVVLFGILLYLTIALITLFVYKQLRDNFMKLISEIASLRQSGMIKEKLVEFSKNEFGMLTQELNAVFADFNEAYQNLENIANKDKLTQLYNRVYADKVIQELIQQHKYFGIILCDIDHFKRINDTYGHLTGDEVLKKFAALLTLSLPESDVVSRWGGEEFLLLIPECQKIEILMQHTEAVKKRVTSHHFDKVTKVTASFGITIHQPDMDFQETMSRVDIALYQAKEDGRNCIRSLL
jgi:diguanylate cyclase (GGDEF)-like protein